MTNIERFINSIESSNSQKVAKYALKNIDDNIENYNLMELEQLILDRKPNSPKEIVTVCYVLGSYSKWLQEQGIVDNDNLYIIDISKEYCKLVYPDTTIKNPIQQFSNDLSSNKLGPTLFVLDNFETINNPTEVFEWINPYIRNPNKVLITSRINRNFKADYPIEVHGMTEEQSQELIERFANKYNISVNELKELNNLSSNTLSSVLDDISLKKSICDLYKKKDNSNISPSINIIGE